MKIFCEEKIKGLYAIADSKWNPFDSMSELAEKILKGGCKILQLRMKGSSEDDYRSEARAIATLKNKYDFTFIVNDHPEVASELGADGVHVGENDMPVSDIKSAFGDRLIVGYSSHSIEEAVKAEKSGADYIAFGAIFQTKTKGPGHPVQGLDKLKKFVDSVNVPTVAIGGIDESNIDDIIATGVSSVAMISAISEADDVANKVREFVELM